MRLLLVFNDATSCSACRDYYQTRGCSVDTAENAASAAALLRFREYDLVIADLPSMEEPQNEILDLVRRQHGGEVRVLLTTVDPNIDDADDSLVVLTKPQRLDAILSAAASARVPRGRRSRT